MPSARYAAALQELARLALYGIVPGTERLAEVLRRLGDPQARLPAIHIAGTNGKGSTAAYCAALLGEAGRVGQQNGGAPLRVGLYTSPHLQRVRERIQLSAGDAPGLRECTEAELVSALSAVQVAGAAAPAITLTFFEVLTAAAFVVFRDAGIDLAVIETGLGGRLDATRLCDAKVTVVTSIGLDHQELLGPTLAAIAREKAGIFRPGVPALAACDDAEARAELLAEAERVGAPLRLYVDSGSPSPHDESPLPLATSPAPSPSLSRARERGRAALVQGPQTANRTKVPLHIASIPPLDAALAAAVPLAGQHQLRNAALAVAAVQSLPCAEPLHTLLRDPQLLRAGLAATRWPGRLERVWPPAVAVTPPPPVAFPRGVEVWLDAAHNPEGAQALDRWLGAHLGARSLTVLFGVVAGKQVSDMTDPLQRAGHVVLTQPPSPRGLPATDLHVQLSQLPQLPGTVDVFQDWRPALQAAVHKTPPGSLLLVYGSIFLIAAVRGWLSGEEVDSLTVQDPGKPPLPSGPRAT